MSLANWQRNSQKWPTNSSSSFIFSYCSLGVGTFFGMLCLTVWVAVCIHCIRIHPIWKVDPNVPLVSSGRDAVKVPTVSVTEQRRVYIVLYSTPTPHSSADFGFPRNFVLKKLGDIYLELSLNPHPCPQGRYTQSFLDKVVVSYKSCMKPRLTQIQGDSNLLTDFFLR